MIPTIAFSNQKGGVGKTTSAVSIAAELALSGYRTLVIDVDPQASASSGLRVKAGSGKDLFDVFVGGASLSSIAVESTVPLLSVVPGSADLVSLEIELGKRPGRELILRSEAHSLGRAFDVIVIDCPPSSGLLSLNALGAATHVAVPLQAEYYALEGLSALVSTIEFVKHTFNPTLSLVGVFMTMFDSRTNLAVQVEKEATSVFGEKMFHTRIPRSVRLSECPSHGLPIGLYDRHSSGARAYRDLTSELTRRLGLASGPAAANA